MKTRLDEEGYSRLKPLLAFASQIRCCVVFGPDGKRLETTWRARPETLELDGDIDLILELAEICSRRDQFSSRYHGRTRSLSVSSEAATILAYPVSDKLILLTADPDFPLEKTDALGELLGRLYHWCGELSTPSIGDRLPG